MNPVRSGESTMSRTRIPASGVTVIALVLTVVIGALLASMPTPSLTAVTWLARTTPPTAGTVLGSGENETAGWPVCPTSSNETFPVIVPLPVRSPPAGCQHLRARKPHRSH